MSAMVTTRQLYISKCRYETSVSTGNYVTILTHLHIQELSPQNTFIYVQQHIIQGYS